jgi:hypothetical protein
MMKAWIYTPGLWSFYNPGYGWWLTPNHPDYSKTKEFLRIFWFLNQ